MPFENKDLKNDLNCIDWDNWSVQTFLRLWSNAVVALVLKILPHVKKKTTGKKKCDKPSPFAASTKTVYASCLFCIFPSNWNESRRPHICLRSTDVKKPLILNCYPHPPPPVKAMSRTLFRHTRCHKWLHLFYHVFLHSRITAAFDEQLCFQDILWRYYRK